MFAVEGLDGVRARLRHQIAIGDTLRGGLRAAGWRIANETPLPLVCFAPEAAADDAIRAIEASVAGSGEAWISAARLRGRLVLRACITSYETGEADIAALLACLRRAL